ncbi:MAG: carboxypeptidase-like regulatory domain-containing protein, partial [Bacteroidota bacterium]
MRNLLLMIPAKINRGQSIKNVVSYILLCLLTLTAAFAQEVIEGKVVDENSEPIPGVNVLVKGTDQGTITDISGQYRLNAPEGSEVLLFSYVGYETQEVAINERSTIDVNLAVDAQQLGEVVVTALGVERETKALGYSVQEIEGNTLTQAREPNLLNSLSGRIAGVQITNGASGVGSSSRITIRGENSLVPGNNSPLFVVDGIPISNETRSFRSEGNLETDYGNGAAEINPDDIENISVLKGAS